MNVFDRNKNHSKIVINYISDLSSDGNTLQICKLMTFETDYNTIVQYLPYISTLAVHYAVKHHITLKIPNHLYYCLWKPCLYFPKTLVKCSEIHYVWHHYNGLNYCLKDCYQVLL